MTTEAQAQDVSQKRWFVTRVQTGREDKVRDGLLRRIKATGLEEHFGDVVVPTEKVSQIRRGKKIVRERKVYPGYIMVEMDMDERAWFLVRETPGIGDFIGADFRPVPMESHEVDRLMRMVRPGDEEPKVKIDFKVGDSVKIKDGPFQNFDGVVSEIIPQKGLVKVNVAIFGRITPVELEYWQVEAV
jgi:transcriptional antiterminator NusG